MVDCWEPFLAEIGICGGLEPTHTADGVIIVTFRKIADFPPCGTWAPRGIDEASHSIFESYCPAVENKRRRPVIGVLIASGIYEIFIGRIGDFRAVDLRLAGRNPGG